MNDCLQRDAENCKTRSDFKKTGKLGAAQKNLPLQRRGGQVDLIRASLGQKWQKSVKCRSNAIAGILTFLEFFLVRIGLIFAQNLNTTRIFVLVFA